MSILSTKWNLMFGCHNQVRNSILVRNIQKSGDWWLRSVFWLMLWKFAGGLKQDFLDQDLLFLGYGHMWLFLRFCPACKGQFCSWWLLQPAKAGGWGPWVVVTYHVRCRLVSSGRGLLSAALVCWICSLSTFQPGRIHKPSAAWTPDSCKGGTGTNTGFITDSWNHRMVRVGKGLKVHLFQSPHYGQGCHSLDQIAQGPIQPDLEHCQAWGIHSLSGQPLPVSHHALNKKCFLKLNLPFFSLKPVPLVLYLTIKKKNSSPSFL